MALHCASRLGVINQLYQKRNEIASALGLIKEIPIAICSSNYDFNQSLKIKTDESAHSLPSPSIQENEVNLFLVTEYLHLCPQQIILSTRSFGSPTDLYCLNIATSIFHPPAV
jgi:hypothetical protein